MQGRNESRLALSHIASPNEALINFWVRDRTLLLKHLHILQKGDKREKAISWTLRFAMLAALSTASYYALRSATTVRDEYEQSSTDISKQQQILQQNQTNLLNQYVQTPFIDNIHCSDLNAFNIIAPNRCYYNITNSSLPCLPLSFHDLSLDYQACSTQLATFNGSAVSLNMLCQTNVWQFPIPNHSQKKLHARFSQNCCPSLYGICNLTLAFPSSPPYPLSQISDFGFAAALSLIFMLAELINVYITEARKALSSPRLLFFPLPTQCLSLSKADQEAIRTVAHQYNITIVENDLRTTIRNFEEKLISLIVPENVDDVPMSRPQL